MKSYFVMWTTDVDADSAEEAAQIALEIQRNPESTAVAFGVSGNEEARQAAFIVQEKLTRVYPNEDEENLREEQADKVARRSGIQQYWVRFDAITSDLHALPLVFATGATLEDLCEQLSMFTGDGCELSEESIFVIKYAMQFADCPSDGMCGTMLTKPINLPELNGMVFHIQLT